LGVAGWKGAAMFLYHVTHRSNQASIDRVGLRAVFARSWSRVWFCNHPKLAWALRHVADSHGWPVLELICYRVDVPRAWLSRWRWGIYTCARDIPASRLRRVRV